MQLFVFIKVPDPFQKTHWADLRCKRHQKTRLKCLNKCIKNPLHAFLQHFHCSLSKKSLPLSKKHTR
ncbi:unnamed protein product [Staurois parvus]|uniref:Uncharacterized protein n=1 Tax=Staurois parvus TaxID=386267 RepID=A0ABN9CSP5_9NEOB|nr:unnamed protein product [Staurois parvus]